jgi:lipopolysaccharide export system permease protein
MADNLMKIFNKYLIKRSFFISFFIFIIFALLDLVFNFISELENLSDAYTFISALKFVFLSMPHSAMNFLEGACLLGVMISLGISHQEGNLNVLRSSGKSPIQIITISSLGPMILVFFFLVADEFSFREIHLNTQVERSLKLSNNQDTSSNAQWVKDDNSLISYTNIIGDTIFNVKFIKSAQNEALYFTTSNSAKISKGGVLFDDTFQSHSFNAQSNVNIFEDFSFPLVARVSFKDIENLGLGDIRKYQKILIEDLSTEDQLFKLHLDKSFYKRIFYPFSILAVIIFFGSFIFSSLRDSSPASRVVLAVVGGFVYRVIQDFSISLFISFSYPILIGVIAPATLLLIASSYSYKKI